MLNEDRDKMTLHARTRIVHRSIRESDLCVVQEWADEEEPRADGAVRLTLSSSAAESAVAAGVPASTADRARRVALVIKDGYVLTVYRRRRGPRLRGSLRRWGRA